MNTTGTTVGYMDSEWAHCVCSRCGGGFATSGAYWNHECVDFGWIPKRWTPEYDPGRHGKYARDRPTHLYAETVKA